jgi:hypothetical protein
MGVSSFVNPLSDLRRSDVAVDKGCAYPGPFRRHCRGGGRASNGDIYVVFLLIKTAQRI